MYASSWFLTIFLTTFPLPIATRIFDIFMSEVTTQYLCSASRVMVKSSYFSSTVKTVLMGKFQIPCLCRFISCLVREDVCACSLRKSKYIFEYRCCKQLYSLSLLKSHRICQKFWMPCDSIVQQGVCFSVVWGEKSFGPTLKLHGDMQMRRREYRRAAPVEKMASSQKNLRNYSVELSLMPKVYLGLELWVNVSNKPKLLVHLCFSSAIMF